ncbi:hypothetical protein [Flagellimonas pacifica]|uniref:MotA/TolQ/ExbB proton channel domain-containing protein n=1 Tax=Flagellimonas pacifica TaxID=1247520 RepID=A0A285MYS8_9FLAO|nr:hypothetical protein [Allomuricauda parva]SNZ00641.1 hypothetical protein SAMN06265377_2466 [Allomuricauda parva]
MENIELVHLLGGILAYIAQFIIIVGCFFLVSKQRNLGTALMLAGAILNTLFAVSGFVWTLISARESAQSLVRTTGIINVLTNLPTLIFGLGLLLYGIKYLKKTNGI